MLGDVNISAILDSFSVSYDKRVRPNYGGKYEYDLQSCSIYTCTTYIAETSLTTQLLKLANPRLGEEIYSQFL